MAANPALWADVQRDLDAARTNVRTAAARAETLLAGDPLPEPLPDDVRMDREYAIGLMLHNGYGAMESALERLVQAVDGALPMGAAYHAELIRRAAAPIEGLRPAMLSPTTAARLQKLRGFRHALRHAYDGYDFARAAENVPIAVEAEAGFRADVTAFARAMGIL
ncbi:ribonuclease toxin HepT-like protein [Azospirillum sp. sgz302134]